jgi:flavin-binding protein dodecin
LSDHVYRVTEIVGSSADGIEQAISVAIERASTTLRHLDWFEVVQVRGTLQGGRVTNYQVVLKVGFRLEGCIPRRPSWISHPDQMCPDRGLGR